MKKILFLFFIPLFGFSQDIKITREGITSLVVEIDTLSAKQIYSNVKSEIFKKYKYPDRVIIADEEGKLLRIKSFKEFSPAPGMASQKMDSYWYLCELEFKDKKYRISFSEIQHNNGILNLPNDFYNKKGELSTNKARIYYYQRFTELFNDLNSDFKKSNFNKKDNW